MNMTVMQNLPCYSLQSLKKSSHGCLVVQQAPFGTWQRCPHSSPAEMLWRCWAGSPRRGSAKARPNCAFCTHRCALKRTIIVLAENTETFHYWLLYKEIVFEGSARQVVRRKGAVKEERASV